MMENVDDASPVHPEGSGWLVEGKRDPQLGRWVVDLISQEGSMSGDKPFFAVYLDEEFSIQWYALRSHNSGLFPLDFSTILSDVVHLETLSQSLRRVPVRWWHASKWGVANTDEYDSGRPLNEKEMDFSKMKRRHPQLRATRRLLGEALARAYGEPGPLSAAGEDARSAAARAGLAMARDYLKGRSSDLGRAFVINGALLASMVFLILAGWGGWKYSESRDGLLDRVKVEQSWEKGLVQASAQEVLTELSPKVLDAQRQDKLRNADVGVTRDQWDLIRFSLIGAAGAMLSLLTSANKRDYDAGAGRLVFALEGGTRILVGVLGALLVTLAIKSELFLPVLTKGAGQGAEALNWVPLFFGFLAGASERLVPSFINVVEAQVQSAPAGKL